MSRRIICENIRSAYNVGNIIRTADALGRGVVISGYTPSPHTQPKVHKSALWAENSIPLIDFGDMVWDTQPAIQRARDKHLLCVAAEITQTSRPLSHDCFVSQDSIFLYDKKKYNWLAVWVGNEVTGVEQSTLAAMDLVVHIPMQGIKASLNVWQAAAIFMRERRWL